MGIGKLLFGSPLLGTRCVNDLFVIGGALYVLRQGRFENPLDCEATGRSCVGNLQLIYELYAAEAVFRQRFEGQWEYIKKNVIDLQMADGENRAWIRSSSKVNWPVAHA